MRSEYKDTWFSAFPKHVNGCKRHDRDVMLSFKDGGQFHDFFLTNDSALSIVNSILHALNYNHQSGTAKSRRLVKKLHKLSK